MGLFPFISDDGAGADLKHARRLRLCESEEHSERSHARAESSADLSVP